MTRARLAAVTIFMLVSFGMALRVSSAERLTDAGSCQVPSALEELDNRDGESLKAILRAAAEEPNANAVLWRIEKDGLAPSYLFATVHVIDDGLQSLSGAVTQAIAQSQIVALESALVDERIRVRMAGSASSLMVSQSARLDEILDEDELKVVRQQLAKGGLPPDLGLVLRPWAVAMLMGHSECQEARARQGLKSLDLLVAEEAKLRGLRVAGLETLLEQYASMASVPDEVQVAWLKSSIAMTGREDEMASTISELYRFRRVAALWDLTRLLAPRSGLDEAKTAELKNWLVIERNRRMLERALPLIESSTTFIAVGAMHVVGVKGLVALLREANFKVTAIE